MRKCSAHSFTHSNYGRAVRTNRTVDGHQPGQDVAAASVCECIAVHVQVPVVNGDIGAVRIEVLGLSEE